GTTVELGLTASATADFSSVVSIDNASFELGNGSTTAFPLVTSYLLDDIAIDFNNVALWEAEGIGTQLSFPNLTSIQVGQPAADDGPDLTIRAGGGGLVQLDALTTLTVQDGDSISARASAIDVIADGTGSLVTMPLLSSFDDTDNSGGVLGASLLEAINGGQIQMPVLTAVDQVSITLDSSSFMDIAQLQQVINAELEIIGGTRSFPALTDLSGSTLRADGTASLDVSAVSSLDNAGLEALNGAVINIPGIFDYLLDDRELGLTSQNEALWLADGAGSRIELFDLNSIELGAPATDNGPRMQIEASNGGIVNLSTATSFSVLDGDSISQLRSDIDVLATGTGSQVLLNSLTAFDDTDSAGSQDGTSLLEVSGGGEIQIPVLTSPQQVSIGLDATGVMNVTQITSLTDAVLTLTGGSLAFPNLADLSGSIIRAIGSSADLSAVTQFDGGQVDAFNGGVVTLSGVTTYVTDSGNFGTVGLIQAAGANSSVSFPNLTDLQVGVPSSGTGMRLDILAVATGTVSFPSLTNITVNDSASPDIRNLDVTADAPGSLVDFPVLSTFRDFDTSTASSISQLNSGVVNTPPGLVTQNVIFLP
ncbi:MAG: hypothetical protein KJO54_05020, partial [Gammaproteobacteria bacterium]|nr:hypothetical protein [Gammaproteobacteria bacterium]